MTALPSDTELREYLHGDLDEGRTAQLDALFEQDEQAAEALQRFAATEEQVFEHLHALDGMSEADRVRLRGSGTFEDLMEAVKSAWETLYLGRLVPVLAAATLFFLVQPAPTGSFTGTMNVGEQGTRGEAVASKMVCEGSRVSATFTSTGGDMGALRTRMLIDGEVVLDRAVASAYQIQIDEVLPTLTPGPHDLRLQLAADGWWSDPVLMELREGVQWAPCP